MKAVEKRIKGLNLKNRYVINRFLRILNLRRHISRKKVFSITDHKFSECVQVFKSVGLIKYDKDFLDIGELIERSIKYCNDKLRDERVNRNNKSGKDYLRHILRREDFEPESPVITLAFDKNLIEFVSNLLGDYPVIADIALLYSPPEDSAENIQYSGSQLFHMDADDVTLCKVWVLLKDVGINDGPTVIVKKSKSFEVAKSINYKKGGRIKNDQQIVDKIQDEDLITILGKAGEVMFIDTAGVFHYGSRVSSGSNGRFMLMISYATTFAVEHGVFGRKSPMRNYKIEKVQSDLTHKQKLMLVNSKKV
jgi:hypothetical protein